MGEASAHGNAVRKHSPHQREEYVVLPPPVSGHAGGHGQNCRCCRHHHQPRQGDERSIPWTRNRQAKPVEPADKDKWIQRERVHWAKAFGVPMNETSPANFPPNTLRLQRALCALTLQAGEGGADSQQQTQQLLVRSLARLWHAFWVEHAEIGNADVFAPILAEVLGQERYNRGEYG
jgi:hypothetical protein